MAKQVTLEMVLSMKDQSRAVLKGMGVDVADLGNKMAQTATKVENLAARYQLQARAAAALQDKKDALEKSGKADATQVEALQLRYDRLTQSMTQTAQQAQILTARLEDQAKVAQNVKPADMKAGGSADMLGTVGSLVKAYAGLATIQATMDWAKQGAAIEQVEAAFGNLAQTAGMSSDEYLAALKRASAGTISEANLMVGANKAVLLAGDRLAKDVPQLLEIARAASKATGEDINFMFDSLVTGLARNSKMIIDNLGITVDVAKAQENYAKSIGKTVEKLTEQERSMAFQAEVMRQGKQMIDDVGAASDTNADKIARANAKLEDFQNNLKKGLGEAAGFVLTFGTDDMEAEVQRLAAAKAEIDKLNQAVISGQTPWAQYAASMSQMGAVAATLSPYQIAIAQSLADTGMSAEAASAAVQGTNQALINEAASAGMSAEALAQVIAQSQMIATVSPEAASTVQGLTQSFIDGTITSTDYATAMTALASETEISAEMQAFMAEQVALLAKMQEYNTIATEGGALALGNLNEEQYNNILAFGEQALAAEVQKERMDLLNDTVYAVANGSMTLQSATAYLADQFNITNLQALVLINTFLRLASVMRMETGKDVGLAGLDSAGQAAKDLINQTKNIGQNIGAGIDRAIGSGVRRAARPDIYGPDTKKKKGGKGGKSEAEKEAEKEQKALDKLRDKALDAQEKYEDRAEDLQRDHVQNLIKINLDYYRKALAAEQKFNTDKFDMRVSFAKGIVDVDQDLWDKANAEEVAYWEKSQAIAQAGDATRAAEYLEAGQKLAQMKAEQAQELRNLDQQIADADTEAEAQRLQQRRDRLAKIYEDEQRLAGENLQKIEQGQDELKKERDEAIAKENADYNEATKKNQESFMEAVGKMVEDSGELTDAATKMVNDLIPIYAQLVSAAQNAANAAAAIGAPASVVNAPQIDGSHALGLDRVPRDGYIAELHKDERVLTASQARMQDRLTAMGRVMQPTDKGMMPVGSPTRAIMPSSNPNRITTSNQSTTVNDNRVTTIYTNNTDRIISIINGETDTKINRFSQRSGRRAINKGKV